MKMIQDEANEVGREGLVDRLRIKDFFFSLKATGNLCF